MLRPSRDEEGINSSVNIVVVQLKEEASNEQPLEQIITETVHAKKKISSSTAVAVPAKILFLDGIRGVAAMLVVMQHSNYLNDINVGATAVDSFFVLSSFLLTMLFLKKCVKMVVQSASYRKWVFAMVDYFMKRFFRVYPFFALVALLLWWMPFEDKRRFYWIESADKYDLNKVLTFDYDHRYLMLWTLPLEITYYFYIPVLVLVVLVLRQFWWIAVLALQVWIVNDGLYTYRTHHLLLRPHISTFLQGSVAAVVFVKFDTWRRATGFEFSKWRVAAIRVVEYSMLVILISECSRAVLFTWIHKTFLPAPSGDPFISAWLAYIIVIEMVLPSSISTTLEWNVLRYWGKVSFSLYLLHPFVIYSERIQNLTNFYDKFFAKVALLLLTTSASYNLVEYPLQQIVSRFSLKLTQLDARGISSGTLFNKKVANERNSSESVAKNA
ncbi:hypothetical protein V7S43_010810 [Phytophthora oleae]|uniref:Acyltransferase 3 domain-containing protein n=1 Tax=Phytophthora oleae TaxID=2107226 RepID=A0ABD3FBW6_9STRA